MKAFVIKIKSSIASGFTLVEFMVIIGIFAIMVGVVMANFNGFRSSVTLDNLAQDIALAIRQVQSAAGASQSLDSDPETSIPQGILFTPNDSGGGYKPEFLLFRDINTNGQYDDGEEYDTLMVKTADKITKLTYIVPNGTFENRIDVDYSSVSIVFKRYVTNAMFSFQRGQTATCIELSSPDTDNPRTHSVCVSAIGQISVR